MNYLYPTDYLAVGLARMADLEDALRRLDQMVKGPSETCDFELIESIVNRGLVDDPRHRTCVGYPSTPTLPCSTPTAGVTDRAQALADQARISAPGLKDTVRARQQAKEIEDRFGDLEPSPAERFIGARLKLATDHLQHLVIAFHPVYGEYDLLTNRRRAVCRNCGPVFGWDAEIGRDAGLRDSLVAVAHQYEIFAAMPDHRLHRGPRSLQAERTTP